MTVTYGNSYTKFDFGATHPQKYEAYDRRNFEKAKNNLETPFLLISIMYIIILGNF